MTSELDIVTAAQRRLDQLQRENARLRAEVNGIRRRIRMRPGPQERILQRALEDAKLILHLRFSGYPVSRRWLQNAGLVSEFRYGWALALLRAGRANITPAYLEELDRALQRVIAAHDRLLDEADGRMVTLRHYAGLRYAKNRYERA